MRCPTETKWTEVSSRTCWPSAGSIRRVSGATASLPAPPRQKRRESRNGRLRGRGHRPVPSPPVDRCTDRGRRGGAVARVGERAPVAEEARWRPSRRLTGPPGGGPALRRRLRRKPARKRPLGSSRERRRPSGDRRRRRPVQTRRRRARAAVWGKIATGAAAASACCGRCGGQPRLIMCQIRNDEWW